MCAFRTLTEVRELTDSWVKQYNEEKPYDSFGDLTSWEYLAKHEPETSNYACNSLGVGQCCQPAGEGDAEKAHSR